MWKKKKKMNTNDILASFKGDPSKLKHFHKAAWKYGFLGWKCHAGQLKIYNTLRSKDLNPNTQEIMMLCSRRFGKSTLGVIMALEDCLRNPGTQVRIIGPTISQTTAIILPIIRKITLDAPEGLIRRDKKEYKWHIGDSELIIGGFDAKNIQRHLGQESSSIYLEESGAADPDEYNYAVVEVLTPQLLHTRGKKIHLTTPPLQEDHPIVTDVIPYTQKHEVFFKFTIFDNPMLNKDQIEDAIRESGGIETPAFRRNYLCEIVKDDDSLVVSQFDENEHVFTNILYFENQELEVVGDWGGVQDKTVILLCSKHKGILFVHAEFYYDVNTESKIIFLDLIRFAKQNKVRLKNPYTIDAPASLLVDFYNQYKIVINSPFKKKFEDGLNFLRQKFFESNIKIHNSCEFLIGTLKNGTLTRKKNDYVRHKKYGHCDAIAALAYASWTVIEEDISLSNYRTNDHIMQIMSNIESNFKVEDKLLKALDKKRAQLKDDNLCKQLSKIMKIRG